MRGGRFGAVGFASGGVIVIRGLAGNPTVIPELEVVFDLMVAVFGTLVAADAVPLVAGDVALWGLYVIVFYRSIPLLVPEQYESLVGDRPLVLVLSLVSVAFAVVVSGPVGTIRGIATSPGPAAPGGAGFLSALVGVLAAGVVVVTLLVRVRFESPFEEGTELYRVIEAFDADESTAADLERYRTADGIVGIAGRTALSALVPALLVTLCFVLGGVTGIAAGFSPLPELLFLVLAVAVRVPLSAPVTVPSDFEWELQRALGAARETSKGSASSLVVLLSLLFSLGTVALGLGGLAQSRPDLGPYWDALSDGEVVVLSNPRFLARLGWVGGDVLIVTAGVLLFWYWLRMARRLPAFARAWDGDDSATTPTARPPWATTVPALLLVAGLSVPVSTSLFDFDVSRTIHATVGLLWPLGLIGGGYWVVRTLRLEAQEPLADGRHVPMAFTLQLIPLAIFHVILGDSSTGNRALVLAACTYLLILSIYITPEDVRRHFGTEGWAVHLVAMGILVVFASVAIFGRVHWAPLVGALLCFVGAAFVVIEARGDGE